MLTTEGDQTVSLVFRGRQLARVSVVEVPVRGEVLTIGSGRWRAVACRGNTVVVVPCDSLGPAGARGRAWVTE